ncbi:MAG: hypothetical protein ACYDDV_04475 [Methanoregula sp.]
MKIAFTILVLILAVLACGCTATAPATPAASAATPAVTATTTIPGVTGIWTGTTVGHSQLEGFREHTSAVYNISAQQGHAFAGTKEYVRADGNKYTENFSGTVSSRGEIFMGDNMGGIADGMMTGTDSMELGYAEDGPDTKAYLLILSRQK